MTTIIGNGPVYTNSPQGLYFESGAVVVEGSRIVDVGEHQTMVAQYPAHEFIDAQQNLIMPGLINAHHHFYSALACGMMLTEPKVSRTFREVLENLWWKLDAALTLEDVRLSAQVSIINSLRFGVTTIVDHHASFGAIEGSLIEIAQSAEQLGVRACLCNEVSDRAGAKKAQEGIEENLRFIDYVKQDVDKTMLSALFGLHASFTLSDETLASCAQAAQTTNTGFHVHVAESIADLEDSLARCNKRVVHRLDDFGIMNANSIAVHCIHTDESEHELLASKGVTVIYNPESNLNNAVGIAPVLKMMQRGVSVGLGTDGYTHDMLESLKAVAILQRHLEQDASVGFDEQFEMLFTNNTKLASKLFGVPLGVIEPGAAADIITMDYDPPTPLSAENTKGHILFGLSGPLCTNTMINGRLVMRNRELLTCDEQGIRAQARIHAPQLWAKM